jgi:hypothetical protein
MPQVRFKPITPMFEQAKPVHALDCKAAVTGTGQSLFKPDQLCSFGVLLKVF